MKTNRYVLVRPNQVDIPDWITIWIDQQVHSLEIVLKGFVPPERRSYYPGRIAGVAIVRNKSGNFDSTVMYTLRKMLISCDEKKEECIKQASRGRYFHTRTTFT